MDSLRRRTVLPLCLAGVLAAGSAHAQSPAALVLDFAALDYGPRAGATATAERARGAAHRHHAPTPAAAATTERALAELARRLATPGTPLCPGAPVQHPLDCVAPAAAAPSGPAAGFSLETLCAATACSARNGRAQVAE